MKVVYVLNTTIDTDGASKSFVEMVKAALGRGISVTVVLPNRAGLYFRLQELGVRLLLVPVRPAVYPDCRNAFYTVFFLPRLLYWQTLNVYSFFKLRRMLRRDRPDIIHTNVSIIDVGYRVAKAMHIPHVYHIREYGELDFGMHYFPSRRIYWRHMWAKGSYSVCITHDIQVYDGLQDNPCSSVVYNGIMPACSIVGPTPKRRYFLYAGRIQEPKGVGDLLEAYNTYASGVEEPCRLVIIGKVVDDNYYHRLTGYVADNGLSGLVEFREPQSDISQLMQHALAIVIPSRHEGFGRCMAEAMANDCLVVGRDVAGTKEQFDNGLRLCGDEIGLRYDCNARLAALLAEVDATPAGDYDNMRSRARSTVARLYTTEAYGDKITKLYTDIIDKWK